MRPHKRRNFFPRRFRSFPRYSYSLTRLKTQTNRQKPALGGDPNDSAVFSPSSSPWHGCRESDLRAKLRDGPCVGPTWVSESSVCSTRRPPPRRRCLFVSMRFHDGGSSSPTTSALLKQAGDLPHRQCLGPLHVAPCVHAETSAVTAPPDLALLPDCEEPVLLQKVQKGRHFAGDRCPLCLKPRGLCLLTHASISSVSLPQGTCALATRARLLEQEGDQDPGTGKWAPGVSGCLDVAVAKMQ